MNNPAGRSAIIEMINVQITAMHDSSLVLVDNVDWSVQSGEFWVLAGPQRSGKSDLLMHAAGLMIPQTGICRVFGCDTREFDESQIFDRLRIGYAFTDGKLFNQFTVAENVALPLRYHNNLTDTETTRAVEVLLELLELTPVANATPGNIAANWRQRTALARALVLKPELLLLDNPNGGLLSRHRSWLVDFLDQLWRGHEFFGGRPMTIVVTTDDLRPWQHEQRQFATLHEGKFSILGAWGGNEFARNHAAQELLTDAIEKEKP